MAIEILLYACFDCERGKPLPVLVGNNNRAHVGGIGCELVNSHPTPPTCALLLPTRAGNGQDSLLPAEKDKNEFGENTQLFERNTLYMANLICREKRKIWSFFFQFC